MTPKSNINLAGAAPTLHVKYGNAAKKQFVLEHPSIVLGRSRGCDIELESGEISAVHCVITRSGEGLVIRDLNSRSGTKLNGERLRGPAVLRDADVIQVGPFSFDVRVPGGSAPVVELEAALAEARRQVSRLEHSRERMADMALALRRRLGVERAARRIAPMGEKHPEVEETLRALADRHAELEQREAQLQKTERALRAQREDAVRQQHVLHAQVEAHEQQVSRFEADQRDFDRTRDEAIQELTSLQNHIEKRQEELTRQQAKAEAEIQAAYQHLEKACAQGRDAAAALPPADDGELHRRKRELSSFAQYLRRYRQRLQERATAIHAGERELNEAWGRLLEAQDRLLDEQRRLDVMREEAERHSSKAAETENVQIAALLDTLARLYAESRQMQDAELRSLRQAVERMSNNNVEITPVPNRFPSALLGSETKPATPAPARRGRLTERVNVAALLDRLGQAKS